MRSCFCRSTAVEQNKLRMPVEISLSQNYPNHFNPTTTIEYRLSKTAKVQLKIYNSLGQEIRTLVDKTQGPGFKSFIRDTRDDVGIAESSGM